MARSPKRNRFLYFCSICIMLCFLQGCQNPTQKAQIKAIEHYANGLFNNSVSDFLAYSSVGYMLDSMNQPSLAKLFVESEYKLSKKYGGFKGVKVISISQESSNMATAFVKINFATTTLEASLPLVQKDENSWVINTIISLDKNKKLGI